LACLATVLTAAPASSAPAFDPSGLEDQLLSQLQQDRAQQGLSGFAINGTLAAFARSAPFSPCPGVIAHGRAENMVERNYFSHQVPPCGAAGWVAVQAAGLPMQAWAENIAWSQGYGAGSAAVVNAQFMASPGHRANILGNYNAVGVGAWPAAGTWSGAGSPQTGVIVFAVMFARVPGMGGPAPPRSAPPPAVAPRPPVPPLAAASAQPAPLPPPTSPEPTSQVRDVHDRLGAEVRTATHLLPARSSDKTPLGPPLLGGLAILLVLVLGPTTALGAALRQRRKTPHT
jgi:uncharacterized protein YkwD